MRYLHDTHFLGHLGVKDVKQQGFGTLRPFLEVLWMLRVKGGGSMGAGYSSGK